MSGRDVLFPRRNNFYLGAFQTAIIESSVLRILFDADTVVKDNLVYRSFIALGQLQRAGRVGASMWGPEWYSSIAARSMSSAVHVEDDGPSASYGRAVGVLSAILGAGAVYTSCQHTINLEPAAAEEFAPRTALNPKEFVKFKVAEVHDVNHNT